MIGEIMALLRSDAKELFKDFNLVRSQDYEIGIETDLVTGAVTTLQYPASDVLKYYMADGSWFAVRPSGTEPKIKFYCSVQAPTSGEADRIIASLERAIAGVFPGSAV